MPDMFQRLSAPGTVPQQAGGSFFAPAAQSVTGIQRVPQATAAKKRTIKYAEVKQANTAYAGAENLGWGTKLETIANGAFKSWWTEWNAGNFDTFADLVYDHQESNKIGKKPDGVLGLKTWTQITGDLGEAVAGITKVTGEGERVCTMASKSRIETALENRNEKLTFGTGKSEETYNIILQSMIGKMADVDLEYRGTGAAGAVVYAGLATFVPEADIWAGKLRPGALIQVWGSTAAYDMLRQAEITDAKGQKRRITKDDADYYGTSMVFVSYGKTNEELILRHFDGTETHEKGDYDKWVAANLNLPASAPATAPATTEPVAEP
jgi:hypothetical protein